MNQRNQNKESSKIFVIGKKQQLPIYIDTEVFDASIESRVRFVQGTNAFIAIMCTYEGLKMFYYFWFFVNQCTAYSSMMIGLMSCNALWVIASIIGFRSINTRTLKTVKRYYYLLWIVFIIRIILYAILFQMMKQTQAIEDIPLHIIVTQKQAKICELIYQAGFYPFQATSEIILLIILLFSVNSVYIYLKNKDLQQFFNQNRG